LSRHTDFFFVTGFEDILRQNGLDSLEALFTVSGVEKLSKPGLAPWRERLRLLLTVGGEERTFFLKRFLKPPLKTRRELRRSGSGARSLAGLEWTWMHRLAADGIPCVRPVAFGQELYGVRELRSAVLTERVPGDSLERWVLRWGEDDRPTILRLITRVAALVARLHQCGYIHRDLYLSHIFYDPTSVSGSALHLIDLQRVMRPRWRHRRWVVKDLAALNYSTPFPLVSRADRLRWLTHYLGSDKLDAPARRMVCLITGKTRRVAGHDRRRAARLRVASGRG